ncbi:ABC transporter permease [Streptomyces nigrescens]|uniref:ABC transporter permease n=1 Tax=Streptomyces nigrescens TaxID=1920 RepID=A0ABY7J2F5_STRNI|nr:ABC transporter permease [Streptomyces nigrescens]WAU03806.1 ABC transporter permease [Streptomyces nigrescens]
MVYALAILVTILSVAAASAGRPSYVSPTNVSNILDQTALLGILVITSTIVLISGNFDLSVGSVAALGAAVCLAAMPPLGFWGAFLLALAAGAGVGLFNGIVVQFVGINAFIVTLGTLTAVRGLVLILTDGRTVTAGEGSARDALRALDDGRFVTPNLYLVVALALFAVAGVRAWSVRRKPGGWTTPAVLAPALAGLVVAALSPVLILTVELTERAVYLFVFVALAGLVMRYTAVGRRLYACGGNAEAARLSGVSVNRYKVVAFILNGTAAALVGVLFASRLGSINPTGLSGFELTALAAAILGGTSLFGGLGSVVKSLVGALILVTLANGFNILNLGANFQGLIEGIVLITAAGMYTIALRRQQSSRIGSHEEPAPAELPPPPTLVPAAPELAAVRREARQ